MEEKYIVTIDGADCTGKSTLWKKANELNKNIQIRGIVSNIAYAIKFGRNVDELLDLYNQSPVNYVVYLLNPNNDKKLEMLYNRLRDNVYNNSFITKELEDASKTWADYEYFQKALEILKEKYKGKIEVIISYNNNLDEFQHRLETYEISDIPNNFINPAIKILDTTIDNFETEAKKVSEFKYIVFINKIDKNEVIDNLYEGLDDMYKDMFNNLMEYGNENKTDIYDALNDYTSDDLADYLDNYEFRCDINIRCEVDTDIESYIPLNRFTQKGCDSLEDYIYNDCDLMDEVCDGIKDYVNYVDDIDVNVNKVY